MSSRDGMPVIERALDVLSHYFPPLVPAWRWAFNRLEDRHA